MWSTFDPAESSAGRAPAGALTNVIDHGLHALLPSSRNGGSPCSAQAGLLADLDERRPSVAAYGQ